MKQSISILIFALTFITNGYGQDATVATVKETFENYRSAILSGKGEEAVRYVDKRTIEYYKDMLDYVKTGDSLTIDGLGLLDKLMVFSIRHRTSRDKVLSFDAKKLFIHAINEGMIGKNTVDGLDIANIAIKGKTAKGQITQQGYESPYYFDFYKEGKKWKIDLTSIFSDTEEPMRLMLEQEGLSSNEYVFLLLEMVTGEEPGKEVWLPVK